jgi:hypothetical protein
MSKFQTEDSRIISESQKPGTRAKSKHKKVNRRLSSLRRRKWILYVFIIKHSYLCFYFCLFPRSNYDFINIYTS